MPGLMLQATAILFSLSSGSPPVAPPGGHPLIQVFEPAGYRAGPESWDMIRDSDGLLFVANNEGILIFDGQSWELIPLKDYGIARSVAVGPDNRIYVGGINQFGELIRQADGNFDYRPLSDQITSPFGNVWYILPTAEKVYFVARDRIFQYSLTGLEELPFAATRAVPLAEGVLLAGREDGLWFLRDSAFHPLPGSSTRAEQIDRIQLMPMGPKRFLQINGELELVFYGEAPASGSSQDPWGKAELTLPYRIQQMPAETREFLIRNQLATARLLGPEMLALGTRNGGLLITDLAGRILWHMDTSSGLPRNRVNHIYYDQAGNLWLAMSHGLVLIEIETPIRQYPPTDAGFEDPQVLVRHQQNLYLGAGNGLFAQEGSGRFRLLQRDSEGISQLHVQGANLYALGQNLLRVSGFQVEQLNLPEPWQDLKLTSMGSTAHFPQFLFLGTRDGLCVAGFDKGRISSLFHYRGLPDRVVAMVTDGDGNLWLTTRTDGIFYMGFTGSDPYSARVLPVHPASLPPGPTPEMVILGQDILALTHRGVFRCSKFVAGQPFFEPHPAFEHFSGSERPFSDLILHQGRLWAGTNPGPGYFEADQMGKMVWFRSYVSRLGSGHLYSDPAGFLWILTSSGLFSFLPEDRTQDRVPFKVILRTANQGPVRLGTLDPGRVQLEPNYQWPLSFSFAAPSFHAGSSVEYAYRLLGSETEWSPWTQESHASFHGLAGGDYRFEVKARNIYNQESEAAVMELHLPRPWFHQRAFWIPLLLLVPALILVCLRLYGTWLKKRYEQEKIQQAAIEQARKMEALGRLAGGIAHDFNRVLANIFGVTWRLKTLEDPREIAAIATTIEAAGERGRHLIQRILDFSKPDMADQVPLCLNQVVDQALDLVEVGLPSGLKLKRLLPERSLWVSGNRSRCQQILLNLCENAVLAMTGQEGQLEVRLNQSGDEAHLQISDTGPGMTEEVLNRIFEPFFTTRSQTGGTGLGLSIVAGLVSAMGGRVQVTSGPARGTVFDLYFPRIEEPRQQEPALSLFWIDESEERLSRMVPLLRQAGIFVRGALLEDQPLADWTKNPRLADGLVLACSAKAAAELLGQAGEQDLRTRTFFVGEDQNQAANLVPAMIKLRLSDRPEELVARIYQELSRIKEDRDP